MSFSSPFWLLLAEAAQPVQRAVSNFIPMADEVKLAFTIGCTLMLAIIGAVFYLGRQVGGFKVQVRSFEDSVKESNRLGEKWNGDLLAALREVDERTTDALTQIAEIKHQLRDARHLSGRVRELEEWRREVDVRCEERARLEVSRRIVLDEGAPSDRLFEASSRRFAVATNDDDSGPTSEGDSGPSSVNDDDSGPSDERKGTR